MKAFSEKTKHRSHEEENGNLMRCKMLVTQVPEVKEAYPFISPDWNIIEFRAPGVLEDYKMDSKDLHHLLVNGVASYDAAICPQLQEFADSVKAPKGQELLAFFSRKYPEHSLHLEGSVYHNIRNYDKLFHPAEVGKLIRSIQWKDDYMEESEKLMEPTIEEISDDFSSIPEPIQYVSEPVVWVESNHRINPTIVKYRLEADLPGRFPADKIAKQIFYQNLGLNVLPYMGKQQSYLPNYPLEPEIVDMVVDHFVPSEKIQELVATEQAQDYYNALPASERPADGRVLIKDMLTNQNTNLPYYSKKYSSSFSNEFKEKWQ